MLTIVVDSFDGYSDLWSSFFAVLKKQWPDCPYAIKLVSNEKKHEYIDTINVGKETCWSDRTLKAIKQIDTNYVLLLLEDYLFGEPVSTKEMDDALAFLKKEGGKYLRLTNIPKSRFSNGETIFPLYTDEEYAINLQAAIWEKNFLIESLEKYPGNAWEFEIGFLRSAVNAKHEILEGCFAMSYDPLHVRNGVLKGKWFPKEIKYFSKLGIDIAWEERGKLSFLQMAKYNLFFGLKNRMSYKMRKKIKSILKKCGMKFVSDL